MTARQIFKANGIMAPRGVIVRFSKGGYKDDSFAYCIAVCSDQYNVTVISAVNPREYSVPNGFDTTVETIENAILYNEWQARTLHNKRGNSHV